MAYIGREPQIGNFQVCDAISVVNGQAAYTMQVSSVNVSPETANHMLVSLNGVLQAPGSSYTVSGSTITFASNLVTGDVINFIHILGSVLDLGVPSDNTVTLAKLASGTDGNLISYDTSGNPVAVATGNSGQVLTSAGAGAVPTFADAGGGAFNLLSTTTVSSAAAAIDITSNIDSTYRNYMIIGSNIHISQNDLPILLRVFSADGSPDTSTNCFHFSGVGRLSDGTALAKQSGGGNNQAEVNIIEQGNGADDTSNFVIHMFNPSGTTHLKAFHGLSTLENSADKLATGDMSYLYRKTIAITGVRFFVTGGTIETGVFKLYGIS